MILSGLGIYLVMKVKNQGGFNTMLENSTLPKYFNFLAKK
jgi:hypothetical protein